jgi:hypothetical protein
LIVLCLGKTRDVFALAFEGERTNERTREKEQQQQQQNRRRKKRRRNEKKKERKRTDRPLFSMLPNATDTTRNIFGVLIS